MSAALLSRQVEASPVVKSSATVPDAAGTAHVLRRLSFGPRPGQVENLGKNGPEALVRTLLQLGKNDSAQGDASDPLPQVEDDPVELVQWLLRRFAHPEAGVHERMVWFWHRLFTTNGSIVPGAMLVRQHRLIRTLAVGNFRAIVRQILRDPAMLVYLNGDTSSGSEPNENLARELLELFTLGHGNFSEDDVRAAAKGLAGWRVDWDKSEAYLDRNETWNQPGEFLGVRALHDITTIADTICDQRACTSYIAARLHEYLCGFEATADRVAELAEDFENANLEILPLVESIVSHPDFLAKRNNIARQPVDWYAAVARSVARSPEVWELDRMGQMPLHAPNVGGWPSGTHWIDRGQLYHRAHAINEIDLPIERLVAAEDLLTEVIDLCGLYELSSDTSRELTAAAALDLEDYERATLVLQLALASPEFSVA